MNWENVDDNRISILMYTKKSKKIDPLALEREGWTLLFPFLILKVMTERSCDREKERERKVE